MDGENIRKLNKTEAEQVNGGVLGDTADDASFLNHIGVMHESVGRWDLTWHWESCSAKVDDGWSKLGITCVTKAAGSNLYFYQGEQISRREAYEIAMGKTGVHVDYSNYNN